MSHLEALLERVEMLAPRAEVGVLEGTRKGVFAFEQGRASLRPLVLWVVVLTQTASRKALLLVASQRRPSWQGQSPAAWRAQPGASTRRRPRKERSSTSCEWGWSWLGSALAQSARGRGLGLSQRANPSGVCVRWGVFT